MTGAICDAVIIGRNEGERLKACLTSVQGLFRQVIYVDSGSQDGSPGAAAALGARVVALDLSIPFTAARARNAGLAALAEDPPDFVQFLDGDCRLQRDFPAKALAVFATDPRLAVVCGRRREVSPEHSVYNRLADAEWDTPVGEAKACGGDALMRYAPLKAAGGYREGLIAGEEPELCLRLRQSGWKILRLDAEMTLHDAAMTRFAQWWQRMRRSGHAFAEGAALHGAPPERHWVRETRRALLWGAALPLVAILGGLIFAPLWALLLAYPLQVLRLWPRMGRERALFSVIGRFPEAQGALGFYLRRLRGGQAGLIEYK